MSRTWRLLLLLVLAIGIILRLASVQWNTVVIHGDVRMDTTAAFSLVRYGQLLVFDEGDDGTDPATGDRLAQHGPVWPVLGAAALTLLPEPLIGDAYLRMRILSLLSGLLVLFLSFRIAMMLLSEEDAWVLTGFLALSWIMIDYAGNGSLYSLQTALYLLWALLALRPNTRLRPLWLGAISGIAYLLNFQCIILLPATILLFVFQRRTWRGAVAESATMAILALFVASPWLIRNAILFGDPLYSHAVNQGYVYVKAGIPRLPDGSFAVGLGGILEIFSGILRSWLPNNLYYVARKLLILAPVASIIAMYGLLDVLFSRERLKRLWPVLLILSFHLLISASWPVMKFRYFIPMLPFVFLLALEAARHSPFSSRTRHAAIGATFFGLIIFSYLTYRAIPTHTYYYDGAVTQDPFHGNEELRYLQDRHLVPSL